MRSIIAILLFCGLYQICFSQNYHTAETTSEKALSAFREGQSYMQQQDAAIALGYFEKALKIDPVFIEAKLAIAETYEEMRDFFKSERAYEEALELSKDFSPAAWFFLAQVEWQLDKFGECAEHLTTYLATNPTNFKNKNKAQRLLLNASFAAEAVKNPAPRGRARTAMCGWSRRAGLWHSNRSAATLYSVSSPPLNCPPD